MMAREIASGESKGGESIWESANNITHHRLSLGTIMLLENQNRRKNLHMTMSTTKLSRRHQEKTTAIVSIIDELLVQYG